jgi:serine protease Do
MRMFRYVGIGVIAAFLAASVSAAAPTASAPAGVEGGLAILKSIEQAFIRVARKASPSVVSISTRRKVDPSRYDWMDKIPDDEWFKLFRRPKEDFPKPELEPLSAGSGVIIGADGYILTNNHVIEEAESIEVRLSDRRPFPAALVKADPRSDLAVIRISATGLPVAPFDTGGRVEVGQWVVALGNPFGFGQDGRATVTHGVVSALGRSLPLLGFGEDRYYGHLIQTDAAINPGNSGGPLLNLDGEVIGINTAIYSTSRGSQGIGFAIPTDARVMAIINTLRRGEEVAYGYLGVGVTEVREADAKRLGVPPRRGALVQRVEPDTPASKAGFLKDDVIVAFNDVPVEDEDQLIREVGATPVGATATITVVRNGKPVRLSVTIARRALGLAATRPALPTAPTRPAVPSRAAWRGLTVQPLTKELADRLGLAVPDGVLVSTVERDSPADKAGLRPGWVIDQIEKESIATVADFRRVTAALPTDRQVIIHTNNGFYVIGP